MFITPSQLGAWFATRNPCSGLLTLSIFLLPWWNFFRSLQPVTPFTVFAAVFASLLAPALFWSLVFFLRSGRRRLGRDGFFAWSFICAFYACLFFLHLPGLVSFDELYPLRSLMEGRVHNWAGLSGSLLVQSSYLIFGRMLSTGWMQLFFLWGIAYLLLAQVPQRWGRVERGTAFVLAAVFLCQPLTQAIVLYLDRDSLFSLLALLFCLLLYSQKQFFSSRRLEILLLAGLLLFLGDLRKEAKVMVVAFTVCFGLSPVFSRREKLTLATALVVGAILYYGLVPWALGVRSYSPTYQIASYLKPLQSVVNKKGVDAFPPAESRAVAKVMNLEQLARPFPPFAASERDGLVKDDFTQEDFGAFRVAALRWIVSEPRLFLRDRTALFWATTNFASPAPVFANMTTFETEPNFSLYQKVFVLPVGKSEGNVARAHGEWLERVLIEPTLPRMIFFSLLPPLAFLLVIPCFFRRHILLSLLSLLVLSRVPALFLLAPANSFKYYGLVWLSGWVFLFLLGLELTRPKASSTPG